ncbi:hypothetical protein [Paracidovorax cattleyae]|uniref:Uncharacterized protein n=1 Tax=Paracidovorax cattleyae TaxID=80868 RepID=A0A1H0SLX2_9BURK|nr:hypothetical protein [Paracidovorax cattleyae]SDP42146.1 hypothetical protein SAMN04489708_112138 [Paracidovorax cattleyae]
MDDAAPSSATLDDFRAFVKKKVDEHFDRERAGMLLQNLGWAIFKEKPELRAVMGTQKLKYFLKSHMSTDVSVIPSPLRPLDSWAFPAGLDLDPSDEKLFRVTAPKPAEQRLRYHPAVWGAFTKPLEPGHRRLIWLEPEPKFSDQEPIEQPPPAGSLTVDVPAVDPGSESFLEEIHARIAKWMQENEVGYEKLAPRKSEPPSHSKSLLDAILSTLDDGDLRRVTLPLDIVHKLLRASP